MSKEEKINESLNLKDDEYIKPQGSKSGRFIIKDNYVENLKHFIQARFNTTEDIFVTKFKEAISGDGDEAKKMSSVRSSSLCALLCFYNVENHPITIEDKTYNHSYFEVKNKVYDNPSNMDVVLTNDEGDILFIESKFAEYLDNKAVDISDKYFTKEESKHIYEKAKELYKKEKNGKYKASDEYHYMGGLKQIISHYVGLSNFVKRKTFPGYMNKYYPPGDARIAIYRKEKYRSVRFIEIIFELSNFHKELNKYKNGSNKLIEILNKDKNGVEYLPPLTYKEVFDDGENTDCLNKEIRNYYFGKK